MNLEVGDIFKDTVTGFVFKMLDNDRVQILLIGGLIDDKDWTGRILRWSVIGIRESEMIKL